jgi:hypothetical protein
MSTSNKPATTANSFGQGDVDCAEGVFKQLGQLRNLGRGHRVVPAAVALRTSLARQVQKRSHPANDTLGAPWDVTDPWVDPLGTKCDEHVPAYHQTALSRGRTTKSRVRPT